MRLWKGHILSVTTGQTTLSVLKRYVESQGEDEEKIEKSKEESKCHICGW